MGSPLAELKSMMLGSGAVKNEPFPRSRACMVHQFEHDAAKIALGERTASFGMHSLRFDKTYAALPQCRDRPEHVGGSQPDALQQLDGLGVEYAGLGVDELQVEAPAWAFQDAPFRENAVALLLRKDVEAEELRVELGRRRNMKKDEVKKY